LHGAGIVVEASQNVTIRKNTISGCANGIGIIAKSRGEDRWTIKNIEVTQNTIAMTKGRTGIVWDSVAPAPWEEVRFAANHYTLAQPEMFAWKPGTISFQQWQAAGEDKDSTFAVKR
jgi:parallel beta-helix repeat protein